MQHVHNQDDLELSHSMVHYLLTIHKLKEDRGYARVTDIAKDLNLTKGSVSTAINNLKKKSLVEEESDSKFLVLTDTGHDEVHRILSSRTLLFYFLKDFVGVEEELAERDSCQMEHLLSTQTSEKFFLFMKKIMNQDKKLKEMNILPENYSPSIDLTGFDSPHDFFESQKGDSYLE